MTEISLLGELVQDKISLTKREINEADREREKSSARQNFTLHFSCPVLQSRIGKFLSGLPRAAIAAVVAALAAAETAAEEQTCLIFVLTHLDIQDLIFFSSAELFDH